MILPKIPFGLICKLGGAILNGKTTPWPNKSDFLLVFDGKKIGYEASNPAEISPDVKPFLADVIAKAADESASQMDVAQAVLTLFSSHADKLTQQTTPIKESGLVFNGEFIELPVQYIRDLASRGLVCVGENLESVGL